MYSVMDSTMIVWFILIGASLLIVGGFVLWVYGTGKELVIPEWEKPSDEVTFKFTKLVSWFLLYGGLSVFAGLGILISSIIMIVQI